MKFHPKKENFSNNSSTKSSSTLFPARVKEIIINNDSDLYKNKGWGFLGSIKFKPLYSGIDSSSDLLIAKPLFNNIKLLPLKEEIVLILPGPSYQLNTQNNSSEFYYFPYPLNIWNSTHHNALPDSTIYNINENELNLGKNFIEKDNIQQLLPEEGDVLIEGRFGNSIRFSSTTPQKKQNNNSWSSEGVEGDPIIIISNNHNKTQKNNWIPIQEDINNDGSSIYICSTQEIPINYSCKNLQSFDITISDSFNTTLEIPDDNSF